MRRQLLTSNRIGRAALLLLALSALLGTTPAAAQPGATAPPPAQASGLRERVKRKILAFRAFRITEELNLDEAGAARVFPLLAKYDQQVEQLTIERLALSQGLRQLPTAAKAVDELIRRTLANRRAFLDLEEQRISELRKVLTAEQTARLLVVLPEVERQIKEQLRRSTRKQERQDEADDGIVDPFGGRKGRGRKNKVPAALDERE